MKRITLLCAIVMMATCQMIAAQKISIKQIASREFRGESILSPEPMPDGETYACMNTEGTKIIKYSFRNGKPVGTLFDVSTARGAKFTSVDGYILSPDGTKILIQTNTNRIYRHSLTATYYIYSIANNKLEPLSDEGAQQTPLFSPDGTQIAFVRNNNIFLVKLLYNNSESQVTTDGKMNEIINGIPDWVNEEEFTNDRSMVFTADSKMIVWVRYDESKVKTYSFPWYKGSNPEKDEYVLYPGEYTYKYPKAGEDNSCVSVCSFDIKAHQTRKMQLPLDADGYIPRIVMTSDAAKVAVYTMNRHQDQLNIYMANPRSTICQLAIRDQVDKYIKEESMEEMMFTSNHILMASERDGRNHLYLYNLNGQLMQKITPQNADITAVYGYDEATGNIYYAANARGFDDQQVYCTNRKGVTTALGDKTGYNTAVFSCNYKYFINMWSDMTTPSVVTLRDGNGKVLSTLISNEKLKNKLSQYNLGKIEKFSFTTSEGVQLNGWMVKPADFDANKKYPVVMYQYGGPGSQQVINSWSVGAFGQGAIFEQYLAQQGYISVCVDGRGTAGRGADFEKQIYLKMGQLEARDQVETAIWLGRQSFIDKDRIAIWGWSFGGFNTLMSMSEGRAVFRAGVAVAPVTNWRFYDSIYTERFMRTPKENPLGYADNPTVRADKLSGALLICHGMADDNVHFQNTAEYSEALVQADKDFSENIYTNRNHSIYGGNTRNHLMRQIVNFIDSKMK